MNSPFKKVTILQFIAMIAILYFCLPFYSSATEYESDNYIISDSVFGNGNEMSSSNFSIMGTLSRLLFGSYSVSYLPLSPGNINSCGKINQPGTYTLTTDISNISDTCFIIATSSVTIDGNGHQVAAVSGNASYAVTATSSVVNGGSAQTGITISNITFSTFAGGINANGNNGTTGGSGGSVVVSSSSLGSIVANGGSPSGNGGSISITGTNMDLVGETLSVTGGGGSVTVNGSILVSGSQVWSSDDSTWLGTRTWNFTGTSYNNGTTTGTTTFSNSSYSIGMVSGDAVFSSYTADSYGIVSINSNTNFHGTGIVTGAVLDSANSNITSWSLSSSSILTGRITGNAIFNDNSYNTGTVTGNTTFNDSSYNSGSVNNAIFTSSNFNSVSGIPNGDPTGISNGHIVTGSITFSTSTPVTFSVGSGSTWSSNTYSWVFATSGQNWIFSSANNTGAVSGNAIFNNSQNNGTVYGTSTFNTNSYNAGTTISALFYNNSYNVGSVSYASFYNTSMNSHNASPGTVTVRCDFYDSSLPGVGFCPSGNTHYHIPYYFNNAVSSNWNDIGNWWLNSSFTQSAGGLPQSGDTVYIGATVGTSPTTPISLGNIYVASSTTGGGSFSVNLTGASGPTHFFSSSTNNGLVNGVMHIYGNRGFSQVNASGTYNNSIYFHNNSHNDTTISDDVVFYDNSYNASNGTVSGNAEFDGTNINDGSISGVSSVVLGASLSGGGSFTGNVSNAGIISGGIFNGVVTNLSSAILDGSVTNRIEMIFNAGSYISSNGQISGDAQFNATSSNRGVVSGTSTFYDNSYNVGLTYNAVFTGEYTENSHNSLNGIVTGTKSRLYTSGALQYDQFRDFTDSAWTVIADNTIVKLLYRDKVDIFGNNPSTLTSTIERNNGFILKPLSTTTSITSCGILDESNTTYTLGTSITGYNFDTCFFVRADGVTLNGNGHSVTAVSNATSLYSIVATSTLSVDATSSAYTNLNIRSITFNNFAHGLFGVGNDVPNGIGGNGASTTIFKSVLADINVNGGDPVEQAGHGGNLFVETSTTTIIRSNGGDSTGCGMAGNGGDIYITTDTVYTSYTNDGGQVSGCAPEVTPQHGSRGHVNTQIISQATISSMNQSNTTVTTSKSGYNSTFSPSNFVSILLPVVDLNPLRLVPLPRFGYVDGVNMFSLGKGINNFLFALLPKTFTDVFSGPLLDLFRSVGLNMAKDLLALRGKNILMKDTIDTPGYYVVTMNSIPTKSADNTLKKDKEIRVPSYIAYDSKNTVTELVSVNPGVDINIYINPINNNKITAKFDDRDVKFKGNRLSMKTPSSSGKHILVTSASPLTLTIDVLATKDNSVLGVDVPQKLSFITRIIDWLKSLFR